MITLPTHHRKNGFNYTQVRRGERSVIYEQTVSETQTCYEVFLIKVQPETLLPDGTIISCKEKFPANSLFGNWAWSFWSLESALIKFNTLEGIEEPAT